MATTILFATITVVLISLANSYPHNVADDITGAMKDDYSGVCNKILISIKTSLFFKLVDCLPLFRMCDEDDECCSESCINNLCVSFETDVFGAMKDDDG